MPNRLDVFQIHDNMYSFIVEVNLITKYQNWMQIFFLAMWMHEKYYCFIPLKAIFTYLKIFVFKKNAYKEVNRSFWAKFIA